LLHNEAALYGALAVALREAREQLFTRGTHGMPQHQASRVKCHLHPAAAQVWITSASQGGNMPTREHDYIIVGAGSAGCVAAHRLSEDPALRVLLLEAGGPDRNPLLHVPQEY